MNVADIHLLFDYYYWANARILRIAAQVTPERFADPRPLSHGGLRGTLLHLLGAEMLWRLRIQEGVSLSKIPFAGETPGLEEITRRWQEEEQRTRAYLASLKDDDLYRTVSYTNTRGVRYENVLWHTLMHVINHGTQHRSEAAVALTDFGQSPGDIDLTVYLREKNMR